MAAIQEHQPSVRFEIFTQVPQWLFEESLTEPYGYHFTFTDIGVAQHSSFVEDLTETCRQLDTLFPLDNSLIEPLVQQIHELDCQLVLCDIAPLGIAVAKAAKRPSVLIENFTWDWIYEGYLTQKPDLIRHIRYLQHVFITADYLIQTEPICLPRMAQLTTPPVSRKIKTSPAEIRQRLQIPSSAKVILITMGGIPWEQASQDLVDFDENFYFIVAGREQTERHGNLLLLSRFDSLFHPDLINASDAVIGKVGYSTLAEVYQAGVPYGYIARPKFRESSVLTQFVQREMWGLSISDFELSNGSWLSILPDLLSLPRLERNNINGADQIAQFINSLL
jgi:hypothetical protein